MRVTVTISLLAVGISAPAESRAEDAVAAVKVYVVRNVDDGNVNVFWAEKIASQIFAGAGVGINWQFGEPTRREQHMPIVIELTENTPKTLAPGALAYAQVYEGVHIRVFCDRIRTMVGARDRLGTCLLAHVMAHEIAHVLEGVDRHSETGLMKAHWTHTEIEEMSVRSLSLAPEDVQLIHNGLFR